MDFHMKIYKFIERNYFKIIFGKNVYDTFFLKNDLMKIFH